MSSLWAFRIICSTLCFISVLYWPHIPWKCISYFYVFCHSEEFHTQHFCLYWLHLTLVHKCPMCVAFTQVNPHFVKLMASQSTKRCSIKEWLCKYIVHLNSMTFQITNYNFQNLLQSFEFTVEDYSLACLSYWSMQLVHY